MRGRQTLGTPAIPELFKLEPTFFAGEPIEDISDGAPANRLIIRMQRTGNEIQISDTLFFDIPNSDLIAHCLRGRTVGGVPDWDTTSTGTLGPDRHDAVVRADGTEWRPAHPPGSVRPGALVPHAAGAPVTPKRTSRRWWASPASPRTAGSISLEFGRRSSPNKPPDDA